MTVQQRVAFLNNKTRTISVFFPKTSDSIKFEINSKIVEDVIGDMFWHPEGDVEEDDNDQDVELITKRNALKLFIKADDADPDAPYKIKIKNMLCFDLATAHTSIGPSFRQTACIIAQHKAICKNPLLSASATTRDTNRWTHVMAMLSWMLKHRMRLFQHIEEKHLHQAPSAMWWIIASSIVPIGEEINKLFVKLQDNLLVLSQQREMIANTITSIISMWNIHKTVAEPPDGYDAQL
ncbi:unnamed protein product [Sphagnum troendelagicum]|uniref:Uncharacterized protein n=1 Tax=Sphagnum troendelagicum TaxID=128251 RepID=A0ABP0TMM4_9BRYO